MRLIEVPEWQEYMQHLRDTEGFEWLLDHEVNNLVFLEMGLECIDDVKKNMTDCWLEAESEEKQVALAKVAHLRACAWDTLSKLVFGPEHMISRVRALDEMRFM